jgi:hypothetical protein
LGDSQNVNRSVIEGLERQLATGNIDPKLNLIAEAFNEWLLPLYSGQSHTTKYRLRFPSSAQADELTQMDYSAKGVLNSIYTPNEARARFGLKPHPDGDKLILGLKIDELSQKTAVADKSIDIQQQAIDLKAQETEQQMKLLDGVAASGSLGGKQPESASASKATNKPIGNTQGGIQRPKSRAMGAGHPLGDRDGRAAAWRRAMKSRTKAEQELRRRVGVVMAEWKATATAAVAAGRGAMTQESAEGVARAIREEGSGRWATAIERSVAAPLLAIALHWGRRSLDRVAQETGASAQSIEKHDPILISWATGRARRFAAALVQAVHSEAVDALQSAVEERLTAQEAAEAVGEVFPTTNSAFLRRVMAGETSAAVGCGTSRAAASAELALSGRDVYAPDQALASGRSVDQDEIEFGGLFDLVDGTTWEWATGLLWIAPPDLRAGCVAHRALDGEVGAPGGRFRAGGADLAFPGDDPTEDHALSGCRCHVELVAFVSFI